MEILSWNVNGIRACISKNCLEPINKKNPDIFCIQETKAHPDQVDKTMQDYEHHFWDSAEKAGYAGTAMFSRHKPLSVAYGMGKKEHDTEGRLITLEFEKFFLITVYVPNSGQELKRLSYRQQWDKDFLHYCKQLEHKKPVIICGDLNVAHTSIDLANPKENYNKTAGYTQAEIDGFQRFLDAGFVDTFRIFHKEPGQYSYWSYRFNARYKNIGWRIDYFLVSGSLKNKVKEAFILKDITGSDHCPVGIVVSFS